MSTNSKKAADGVQGLVAQLEPYFTKQAPFQLPPDARKWIIEYAWLVSLVVALLSLPGVLAVLGLMGLVGTVATMVGVVVGPLYWLAGLALAVQVALTLIAVPGLKAHSYSRGWMIVFYGTMFSLLSSVLHLTVSSIVGGLVGAAISLYILFQVKEGFR